MCARMYRENGATVWYPELWSEYQEILSRIAASTYSRGMRTLKGDHVLRISRIIVSARRGMSSATAQAMPCPNESLCTTDAKAPCAVNAKTRKTIVLSRLFPHKESGKRWCT